MADIGFAAFDPVFMLHHANVDRLFELRYGYIYSHPNLPSDKELKPFP